MAIYEKEEYCGDTINIFQMQCSNIRKEENDRGLIIARKYDLRCRNIAYGTAKSEIIVENEEDIVDDMWHARNIRCWSNAYKTGASIETNLVTIYPTKYFEGACNSDVFVMLNGKIYVADTIGWTIAENVQEAISRIIFYDVGINWNEILNKEQFAYFDNYWIKLREEQNEKLKLISRKLRHSSKTI